jgi:hypothetical protein
MAVIVAQYLAAPGSRATIRTLAALDDIAALRAARIAAARLRAPLRLWSDAETAEGVSP